jgi:voltage-gated sodium channel
MTSIKENCRKLISSKAFEITIAVIIVINSLLVGISTYMHDDQLIEGVQHVILLIFTAEIGLRFFASRSIKSFFLDGWNLFDLALVLSGFIPVFYAGTNSNFLFLRVIRILRVLRMLRLADEIKLIAAVLTRSLRSLFFNGVFFLTFMYLYALLGNMLFKLPEVPAVNASPAATVSNNAERLRRYNAYIAEAPHSPSNSPDPFGTLGESMFTLFRISTGEDWTDVRYNLITASKHRVVNINEYCITGYLVSWYAVSVFLLLNLLVGAIVNDYQVIMGETRKKHEAEKKKSGSKSSE